MTESIVVGGHHRIRPFNTADTYPEQHLSNDLCQAVVAGQTVYLRGQVAQDLDTRESVAIGDPAGQARKVMDNIELLLGEAGAHLALALLDVGTELRDLGLARGPVLAGAGGRGRGVVRGKRRGGAETKAETEAKRCKRRSCGHQNPHVET